MTLDPKKFAFLTTAIAASIVVVGVGAGCDDDIDAEGVGDGGISSSSSSSGSTSSSSGSTSSSGGSSSGSTSSSSGSLADGGSDAGACLGDDGSGPDCDDQGTACLTDANHEDMCSGYNDVFRSAVAKATVDCLRIAPTCEMGSEPPEGSDCAKDAVAQACPIADAATKCTAIVTASGCDDAAQAAAFQTQCEAFVPALTDAGMTGLQACAAQSEGCDFFGFCLDPSYASTLIVQQPVP